MAAIDFLLSIGCSPSQPGGAGVTPLMLAAAWRTSEILIQLISAGADPKAQDAEGRTAIDVAAAHGRAESVEILLEAMSGAGSAIDDRVSASSWQPALTAAKAGHYGVVAMLIGRGKIAFPVTQRR